MKTKNIHFEDSEGIPLDAETRDSVLDLLDCGHEEATTPVIVWNYPIHGPYLTVKEEYIMSKCSVPVNTETILNQTSLLEESSEIDTLESTAPLVPPRPKPSTDDEELVDQIMSGPGKFNEEEENAIFDDAIFDDGEQNNETIIGDENSDEEFDEIPASAIGNHEILNIFKRENCLDDPKCSGTHFFIVNGVLVVQGRQYVGWHIYPEVGTPDIMPQFKSVLKASRSMLNQ